MDAKQDLPDSVDSAVHADPIEGDVKWSASKSLWWLGMILTWFWFAISTISLSALLVFLVSTAITWQIHCKLHLVNPPRLRYPDSIQNDLIYRFLQSTSMLQQAAIETLPTRGNLVRLDQAARVDCAELKYQGLETDGKI